MLPGLAGAAMFWIGYDLATAVALPEGAAASTVLLSSLFLGFVTTAATLAGAGPALGALLRLMGRTWRALADAEPLRV